MFFATPDDRWSLRRLRSLETRQHVTYFAVDPRVWDDEKVVALSRLGKLVWFLLLTGPHRSMLPGLQIATAGSLAETLREPPEDVAEALREIEAAEMIETDARARLIRIPNAPLYHPQRGPKIILGWWKLWQSLPESILKYKHLAALHFKLDPVSPESSKVWAFTFGRVVVPPRFQPEIAELADTLSRKSAIAGPPEINDLQDGVSRKSPILTLPGFADLQDGVSDTSSGPTASVKPEAGNSARPMESAGVSPELADLQDGVSGGYSDFGRNGSGSGSGSGSGERDPRAPARAGTRARARARGDADRGGEPTIEIGEYEPSDEVVIRLGLDRADQRLVTLVDRYRKRGRMQHATQAQHDEILGKWFERDNGNGAGGKREADGNAAGSTASVDRNAAGATSAGRASGYGWRGLDQRTQAHAERSSSFFDRLKSSS